MLDHREFLKEDNQLFERLASRGVAQETMDSLSSAAGRRRTSIQSLEEYRRELNAASAEMKKVAASGDKDALAKGREALQALKAKIKDAEQVQRDAEEALGELLCWAYRIFQISAARLVMMKPQTDLNAKLGRFRASTLSLSRIGSSEKHLELWISSARQK